MSQKSKLIHELVCAEKETGIILSNSPTQTVGYKAVSSLEKVQHRIPLLSLDKTKMVSELASFAKDHASLLMLKLDGLTVKLVYKDGKLVEGSTRDDGDKGELITHNIAAFRNVPLSIPYKGHLELSGEGFIQKNDFERLKGKRWKALPQCKEPCLRLYPVPGCQHLQGSPPYQSNLLLLYIILSFRTLINCSCCITLPHT